MLTETAKESLELIDKDIIRWTNKKLLNEWETIDSDFLYDRLLEARIIVEASKRGIFLRR
tara:strand:+ start:349 stop:528 length:180 start_codon:yes stop_codon:yes gene_type:complete